MNLWFLFAILFVENFLNVSASTTTVGDEEEEEDTTLQPSFSSNVMNSMSSSYESTKASMTPVNTASVSSSYPSNMMSTSKPSVNSYSNYYNTMYVSTIPPVYYGGMFSGFSTSSPGIMNTNWYYPSYKLTAMPWYSTSTYAPGIMPTKSSNYNSGIAMMSTRYDMSLSGPSIEEIMKMSQDFQQTLHNTPIVPILPCRDALQNLGTCCNMPKTLIPDEDYNACDITFRPTYEESGLKKKDEVCSNDCVFDKNGMYTTKPRKNIDAGNALKYFMAKVDDVWKPILKGAVDECTTKVNWMRPFDLTECSLAADFMLVCLQRTIALKCPTEKKPANTDTTCAKKLDIVQTCDPMGTDSKRLETTGNIMALLGKIPMQGGMPIPTGMPTPERNPMPGEMPGIFGDISKLFGAMPMSVGEPMSGDKFHRMPMPGQMPMPWDAFPSIPMPGNMFTGMPMFGGMQMHPHQKPMFSDMNVLKALAPHAAYHCKIFLQASCTCCERPKLIPEKIFENCETETDGSMNEKPFGMMEDPSLCQMDCAFRNLSWIKDNVIDSDLTSKLVANIDSEMVSTWESLVKEASNNCSAEITKAPKADNGKCNADPSRLMTCIDRYLVLNCPHYNTTEQRCMFVRKHVERCDPFKKLNFGKYSTPASFPNNYPMRNGNNHGSSNSKLGILNSAVGGLAAGAGAAVGSNIIGNMFGGKKENNALPQNMMNSQGSMNAQSPIQQSNFGYGSMQAPPAYQAQNKFPNQANSGKKMSFADAVKAVTQKKQSADQKQADKQPVAKKQESNIQTNAKKSNPVSSGSNRKTQSSSISKKTASNKKSSGGSFFSKMGKSKSSGGKRRG